MFVRNCWYVIAWEHELADGALLARRVLDEPIVVYRTSSGALSALEDRCCHRHAPLSAGRREGDDLRCMYHGLRFDASGHCVEIPGIAATGAKLPAKLRVRSYPVALHRKWVFVWMGDPAQADVNLLPDNYSCDHPDWRYLPGYLHYDTPYELICDNLLDFSHLSYVHEQTLGGSVEIAQSHPVIEALPRGVRVRRHVPNVPPPPYYAKVRDFGGARVNRWFIYDFVMPGILLMESGGRPVGDAPDDDRRAVRLHSCQALTPETATSTHYFVQQAHRADAGDAAITRGIHEQLLVAFEEDRRMITAQHRNLAADAAAHMQVLWMDAALVQFRRLKERMAREEARGGVGEVSG